MRQKSFPYRQQVGFGQGVMLAFQAGFDRRLDLVGHRLARFARNRHQRLARVLVAARVAGQRNNHDPSRIPVGRIVADHHRRSRLATAATQCEIKFHPLDFTALH